MLYRINLCLGLLIISLIVGCSIGPDGSMGASAGKFVPASANQITKAKALVTAKLIDPESARFNSITTDGKIICGFVNSKNSFGGYVGNSIFVIDGTAVHISGEGGSPAWSFYGCPGSWQL